MKKQDLARHLALALESDDLRERVELIHTTLTKKKEPTRPGKKVVYDWVEHGHWTVTLHHIDADRVDELWADFISRRDMPGEWIRSKEFERVGPWKRFTFKIKKPAYTGPRTPAQKKDKKEDLLQQFATMTKEEQLELIAKLQNGSTH